MVTCGCSAASNLEARSSRGVHANHCKMSPESRLNIEREGWKKYICEYKRVVGEHGKMVSMTQKGRKEYVRMKESPVPGRSMMFFKF